MKGKVITITSGKGGVGKSTITSNIAHYLAWCNYRTLVIDLDIGLKTLDFILGIPENELKKDIIQLINGEANILESLVKVNTNKKDLYFIPAAEFGDKTDINEEKFKNIIMELKKKFDYIVIDSPAGIEDGFLHSISYADSVILTITPDVFSLKDADKVLEILDEKNEQIDVSFIINKFIPQLFNKDEQYNIDSIRNRIGLPLLGIIEFDSKVIKSTDIGKPISLHKNSKGGEEFRSIVKRYLGEDVPLPKYSFLDRIKNIFNF